MDIRPFGCLVAVSAFFFCIAVTLPAAGDTSPSEAQIAAARDLFLAAERDEDAQRWGDALEKLQRVSAVKLTSGVRYHTALCEEHLGHLVAALRDYKTAANQARAENAVDVLRLVDKRVVDANNRVPSLVVVLIPNVPDAAVSIDGDPIQPGTPVTLDPGPHTVEARASGRSPSTLPIAVGEHDSLSVEMKLSPLAGPAPLPAAATGPAATKEAEAATHSNAPRDRAIAIAATAGAATLIAGGIGAYAVGSALRSDEIDACAQVVTQRPGACDNRKDAIRRWDWVAVGAWAGAVAASTLAVVSFIRLRREASASMHSSAQLIVGPASLQLDGSF